MSLLPAISVPLPWFPAFFSRFIKAKGSAMNALRLPRSLKVTREGRYYIGVLIFIGIAAINTGNNLLYLVVAAMLSLIIVSGVMSESTIKAVSVEMALPRHVFKGEAARAALVITNNKKFVPSFSFAVSEGKLDGLTAQDVYILKLKPGEKARAGANYLFLRRGVHRLEALNVTTRFPFGLFVKGRDEASIREVTVLPSVRPVKARPAMRRSGGGEADFRNLAKGAGTGLSSLREYTPSDDARFIHWRSAAKSPRLLSKEFDDDSRRAVTIVFENRSDDSSAFEDAVDRAASLADHFIRLGCPVGLKTLSGSIAHGAGKAHLYRLLYFLAEIKPEGRGRPDIRVRG